MIEIDGTTIGGRPFLSVATVQSWYSHAGLTPPSDGAVEPIAQAINHLDLFQKVWKDDPDLRDWRGNAPSLMSLNRVAKSIYTICMDMPDMIDQAEAISPGDYEGYKTLLLNAQLCLPRLEPFLVRKKGRRPDNWHNVARNLKLLFKKAARTTEAPAAGFGQLTATGIPLLRSALLHLGLDKTDEQIVDALRTPRKRLHRGK